MYKKINHTIIATIALVIIITIINYYYYIKRPNKYIFKYFQTAIIISLGDKESRLSTAVINDIDTLLKNQEKKWFNTPDSAVIELNHKLSQLKYFTVDDETVSIIKLIQDFYKKSHNYFNPTMGQLFNYWENQKNNHKLNLQDYLAKLPEPHDIKIQFDPKTNTNSIKNTNPYLQLDIDAIISAHILRQLKQILLANNIEDAELIMDNDLYLLKKGHSQNYKIVENHTNSNKMPTLNITTYDDEYISVSGTLVRHTANQSMLMPNYIINPKTGKPSNGFYGATVISKDPYKASIASMTLIIAGEQEFKAVAKSLDITDYVLYTYNNKIILSDGMRNRLMPPESDE
jgi:thiamine biosynthesis lipoprotein